MRKVIIVFGLPGAGKTTYIKCFREKNNNFLYVCPDDLVASSSDLTIWPETIKVITDYLQKGDRIIIEAAAASFIITRKSLIKFLRERGVEQIEGWYFLISLTLAKERNNKKEKPRPEEIIERMNKDLQNHPPTLEDGFDHISIIKN